MSDTSLEPVDGDLPVNPYSLLEAVNSASNISRSGWVLYLALMAYLLVAVAGVTHKELLLNSPIPLPILQVDINLASFFSFAPLGLLFTHFGMLVQHVMLARKVIAFDESLQPLETSRKPTHPLRLELHSYFFTQALAGPQRSWLFGFFLQAMIWLSLVVLPVFLILYIQVIFLPYHSESVTYGHRVVLVLDVALLVFIGVFMRSAHASFFTALWRVMRYYPLSFIFTAMIFVAVILFSFFVATVPDEFMDRMSRSLPGADAKTSQATQPAQKQYFGYAVPFLYGNSEGSRGALLGLFHRNLIVEDLDLVSDGDVTTGEPTLNLRGRDLRNARLDRSDLHQADFTGANLSNASLIKTDLRSALLTCVDLDRLRLDSDRKRARCTILRGANLSGAKLKDAVIEGGDFSYAKLEEAVLTSATASYALFTGANLFSAQMQKINMSAGVVLTGANLLGAQMQGALLTGAKLQGADLSGAGLQGAGLDYAHLQGANLLGAELNGANLRSAILYGADLSDANLSGADLSKARIWLTVPPSSSGNALMDLSGIQIANPRDSEIEKLDRHVNEITDRAIKDQVLGAIGGLLKTSERSVWRNSDDITAWRTLAASSSQGSADIEGVQVSSYNDRLTHYLSRMMCSSRWNDGSLATGIVVRATNQGFNGDAARILNSLKSPDCPASKGLDKDLLQRLSNKVQNVN